VQLWRLAGLTFGHFVWEQQAVMELRHHALIV